MQVSVSNCLHIALGFFSSLINIIDKFSINNWKMLNVHLSFWTSTFAQKYFLLQLMLGAWIEFFRNLISRRNILSFFYSYVQNGFARLFTCWLQKTQENKSLLFAVVCFHKFSVFAGISARKCTIFMHFWNFDWKALFLGILSIQCKIRRDQPTDTRRSTGRSRSTCWPPLVYTISFSST